MARTRFRPGALGAALSGLVALSAEAQFGFYTLPQNDFTWTWGDIERRQDGRFIDIKASGSEPPFRCEVTAALRPGNRLSPNEVRELANRLQGSIQFVRDTVYLLNDLDAARALDWAQLSCMKHEGREVTEEQRAERESKARERMQREVERRRERQQRADD